MLRQAMHDADRAPEALYGGDARRSPGSCPALVTAPGGIAFRPAPGSHGRAALEVLADGEVLGVHVEHSLGGLLLGALRGRRAGAAWALAWGRLPPDGSAPAVAFDGGQLRRRSLPVRVVRVGERFWAAWAEGEFRTVTVAGPWADADTVETWRLVHHAD